MDVQQEAGYNMFDVWGFFATYGWPVDIVSAVTPSPQRIHKVLKAAKDGTMRHIRARHVQLGLRQDHRGRPAERGKMPRLAHPHAMCDANPKSFEYVKKILDTVLGQWDFGGVHLESCDLGCCMCPQCAGKDGIVGYNVRINQKTADYIEANGPIRPSTSSRSTGSRATPISTTRKRHMS